MDDKQNQDVTVLVTGATGYVALWCIIHLLNEGYQVRGTVRSMTIKDQLLESLQPYAKKIDSLSLFEAELMSDTGWDEAMAGCEYVLHIASPFPLDIPEDEEVLIRPAVEGTQRILAAAVRAGVKRVVLTSSIAAISSAHPDQNRTFTEADWSFLDGDIQPYPKSKTLAERAAWKFVDELPLEQKLELVVINPGFILGPVLTGRSITSMVLHKMLMKGNLPGVTNMKLNIVDVRDVAKAHLSAMVIPEAAGKRFVCVADGIFLPEFARIMAAHFGPLGYRIPTLSFPSWAVRLFGLFNKTVRENARGLGQDPKFDNSRIKEILNWRPYPVEKTIIDMGESLIAHGVVEKKSR